MFCQPKLPLSENHTRPAASNIALALQGGGTYGAFTWGVLDRMLAEDGFVPSAISGASAGAMNAVMIAWGLLNGGRQGARDALAHLWNSVGKMSMLSPMGLPGASLQFDLLSRVASPYQFNPLNINPLRDLLEQTVDFDRLREQSPLPLFISATHVGTGQQRIFREHELTADVLLASACIPYLSQAVEINGEAYWDGGFSSNPPVLPLVLETQCQSVLLVKLTPDVEPDLPTMAPEIFSRLKRILFNTPLLRELDALEEMRRLLRQSSVLPVDLRRVRDMEVRQISIGADFFESQPGGALGPRPDLLARLHQSGMDAAQAMLAEDAEDDTAPPLRMAAR